MKYLKIKDNVDLKELEKFGFIEVKKDMTTFVPEVKYWYTLNNSEYDCVTIHENREIYFGLDCNRDTYCIVYDLIKADMVEIANEC